MAEREWYYAQGNRQEGPISERGLIELLAVGKLPLTTLVWCEEMSNWSPASTVDVFRALGAATQPIAAPQQQPQQYAPAPNSPPPLNIVQQQSYNPPQPVQGYAQQPPYNQGQGFGNQGATLREQPGMPYQGASPDGYSTRPRPWHRFFARCLDNSAVYAVPENITSFILLAIIASVSHMSSDEFKGVVPIALLLPMPIPFFAEAVFLSFLGATPGKMLLNIRVRNRNGSKLSFMQALQRTGAVWLRGGRAVAYIPLIGGFAAMGLAIYQFMNLNKNGITSWDRNQDLIYEHGPIDGGRIVGIVALAFFAFVWTCGFAGLIIYGLNNH